MVVLYNHGVHHHCRTSPKSPSKKGQLEILAGVGHTKQIKPLPSKIKMHAPAVHMLKHAVCKYVFRELPIGRT